jgi:hypothetical protein
VSITWLSSFIRHGRGYMSVFLLGLDDEKFPRSVLTSLTTAPSADAGFPAPVVEPAGAPAGTTSLIVVEGIPSGADVIDVTASAPS